MKTRFRIKRGWFGRSKIVLQVEYRTFCGMTMSGHNAWRDATEEDLTICIPHPAPCPGEQAQDSSTEKT